MSGQVKTIVRILRSVGSITLGNGNLVLLSTEGGNLIEKIYDGEDLKDQRKITEGVRDNSSAVYVVTKENAFVLYVNSAGEIKASEFDPDSEEWDDAELSGLGTVKAHPSSHLAVAPLNGFSLVFFQGTDGAVKTLRYDEESKQWKEQVAIPGDAATGTPISAFATDKAVAVSFIGGDNVVHVHKRDYHSGDWTDTSLSSASWKEPLTSLIVSQDTDTGELEAFALVTNSVDHVKKDGTLEPLGSIQNDAFVPATKAEAGDVYGNNYGTINNNWNYGYGGYGGYCPPPCPPPCPPRPRCWY